LIVGRLALIQDLAVGYLKGKRIQATSFLRVIPVPLISEKVFDRSQQESSKAAFIGIGAIDVTTGQASAGKTPALDLAPDH
jgi:hypothetical protein